MNRSACALVLAFVVGCSGAAGSTPAPAPGDDPPAPPRTSDPSADPTAAPPAQPAAPPATPPAAPPPPASTIETVLTGIDDVIDFDVREADIVVLRTTPSRIDACSAGACAPLVATDAMPTEFPGTLKYPPNQYLNASIAYVATPGAPTLVVAQSGINQCAATCPTDYSGQAGLYTIALGAAGPTAPQRVSTTMPLVYAKAYRKTDGKLVGRGGTFAVQQVANNEAGDLGYATVFTVSGASTVDTHRYDRTTFSPGQGYFTEPFLFAAATTPNGFGGYTAAYGDLVDVSAYTAVGVKPTVLAAAAVDADAAVVTRAAATPDGKVLVFQSMTGGAPAAHDFAGVTATSTLLATATQIAWFDASATSISLHVCPIASVTADTCAPREIALGATAILRTRVVGDVVYVLATVGGKPTITKVHLAG